VFLSFSFLFIGIIQVFSQNAYIATDSSQFIGIKLMDASVKDNCQFIKVKSKEVVITYMPDDLLEYGFKDGTTYVSKTISVNGTERRVFLKRLVKDKTALYYYSSSDFEAYYLETEDSILIELSKKETPDYKNTLITYMRNCPDMTNSIKLVRYEKSHLSRLVSIYNTCSPKPFPYRKFGLIVGYGQTGLSVPEKYAGDISQPGWTDSNKGFVVGLTADIPINASNFSINTSVLVSKNGYSYNEKNQQVETDILINFTSIDVPVLVRYTVPSMKLRPFVNGGGVFSYHMNNTSNIYQATVNQDVITINEISSHKLVSDEQFGFSIGGGVQKNINYKNTISVELRYSKLYANSDSLNKSQLAVFTVFTF
jgi:hypothetical protein